MARFITRKLLIAGAISSGLGALGGCSSGGDGVATVQPPPPPPPVAMGAVRFGTGFATAFQAGTNTDPRDPMQADIIAASFSTDPLEVP